MENIDLEIEVSSSCHGEASGELFVDNLGDTTLMTALNDLNYSTDYYYNNLLPGEHILNVTNSTGCEFAKNITIVAKEPPEVNEILINPATCDKQNGYIDFISSNSSFVYSFNDGSFDSVSSWTNLAGGTYIIKYKNSEEGCLSEEVVVLEEYTSPNVDIISLDSAYCGEANGKLVLSVSEGYPPFEYSLNASDFGNDHSFEDLSPQIYSVIVRDKSNCQDTIYTTIEAVPFNRIDSILPTPEFCNEQNGSVLVIPIDDNNPYTIEINDTIVEKNFLENLSTGLKKVKLTDHNGCLDSMLVYVDSLETPKINEIIYAENPCGVEYAQIFIEGSSFNNNLLYSTDENHYSKNNSFALRPDEHILSIKDEMGCVVDTVINISKEESFLLANIFSPNSDGINDEFCFQHIVGVEWVDEFHIYDRWGNMIYTFTNPSELMLDIC